MNSILQPILLLLFLLPSLSAIGQNTILIPHDPSLSDHTSAIRTAFTSNGKNNLTFLFEPGKTYHINGNDENDVNWESNIIFWLDGYNNIIIDGRGATLSGGKWGTVFRIINCQNVKIKNLTIDWKTDQLPYIAGQVSNKTNSDFILTVDSKYALNDNMPSDRFTQWDPALQRPARNGYFKNNEFDPPHLGATDLIDIANRKIKVPLLANTGEVQNGDHLLLYYKKHPSNVIHLICTDAIEIDNCTIYGGVGLGIFGMGASNILIKNTDITRRDGLDASVAAAATRFWNCRGQLEIRDCNFIGVGDDGSNVQSKFLEFHVKNNATTYTFKNPPASVGPLHNFTCMDPQDGDHLELSKANDPFNILATPIVDHTERIMVGNVPMLKVTFKSAPSGNWVAGDKAMNIDAVPSNSIFKNILVKSNRGRGLILGTRNVMVDNCRFTWISGPGIEMTADAHHFHEGPSPKNITIKNTTISQCNYGHSARRALISAYLEPDYFGDFDDDNYITNINIDNLGLRGDVISQQKGYSFVNTDELKISNTRYLGNISDRFFTDPGANQLMGCDVEVHLKDLPNAPIPYAAPSVYSFFMNIEAEHFDNNGETISYHDRSEGNAGGQLRTGQDVDIKLLSSSPNNYYVYQTDCKEWLNYTFDVPTAGNYQVRCRVGYFNTNIKLHLEKDGQIVGNMMTSSPRPDGWRNVSSGIGANAYNVPLDAGENTLKLVIDEGDFRLDWIRIFWLLAPTPPIMLRQENTSQQAFSVFPSPADEWLNINNQSKEGRMEIFAINGRLMRSIQLGENESQQIDISAWSPGVYLLRMHGNNQRIIVE